MEAPIPISQPLLKTIKIENEEKKYIFKFQVIEESIHVSIFLLNSLKYNGSISLDSIKMQIVAFSDININDVLQEINLLDLYNFSIIKENDKYKLKIKFIVFSKEKYLIINLEENKDSTNISNNDLISYYENIIKEKDNTISELKEIIKFKDEKIKALEDQLKNNKKKGKENTSNDNSKNDILSIGPGGVIRMKTSDFNVKLNKYRGEASFYCKQGDFDDKYYLEEVQQQPQGYQGYQGYQPQGYLQQAGYVQQSNYQQPVTQSVHEHPLYYNQNLNEKCKICQQKIGGKDGYKCGDCPIVLCLNCANRIFNGNKKKSVHSHDLVLKNRIGWKCDICNQSYRGIASFYCQRCDFDVCHNCYLQS